MIKLALISDIHYGKDGRGDFRLLCSDSYSTAIGGMNTEMTMGKDLIDKLNELKPEYLFIAGDLTSIGSPAEYYYCEQKILQIANSAGIDPQRIIWCVGNHDNDWSISKISDNYNEENNPNNYNEVIETISKNSYSKMASRVVESNINSLYYPTHRGVFPANGIYTDDNIIVFVLNSATKSMHYEKIDHGEITDLQRKWLEEKLHEYQNDLRWKIVLLHHHPFNYTYPNSGADYSHLTDGSEFLEIIGKGGVHIVLHGHRHHPYCKTMFENGWKNPISFICAGSLAVNEKQRLSGEIPNMFHMLELEENDHIGQLYLYSYAYLPGTGWSSSQKRGKIVPTDSRIRMGKIVETDTIRREIENLVKNKEPIISIDWDELNEDLQFVQCDVINKMISETLSDRYDVKANLPENLTLKIKRR